MKKIKAIVAFLILATASVAQAQTTQKTYEWKQATSNGYTYKYVSNDPANARFYTLKNGLTVILSPTPKEPRIQSFIAVKAGSKTDPSDHTGLAHYLEHMMFKGTDKYGSLDWAKEKPLLDEIDNLYERYNATTDETQRKAIYQMIDKVSGEAAKYAIANEYDKMMASMGGQGTNAFTSFEQTVYTDDIPSSALDKYLALQAERFRNPVLRIFHTELEAVYEEKNRTLDSDPNKVFEAMFAGLFPNNNYGKQTTIGTVEHLKNPSLKAIRNYYNQYYVPNNMGIIMSGDFDPDVMIKKIDQRFSYLKNTPVPAYNFSAETPISSPVITEVFGPNPENIMIGYRFPGASTKDAQMLNLVGEILTNGKAGLFDLNLVKKQQLLSASAFSYTLKDYSVLLLQGNPTKGQSLDEVKTLMLGEIEKLKKGEFSDELITSIVNNLKKSNIEQNEKYFDRASSLMDAFTSGIDWKNQVANISDLSKVSKKDIVAFANKYLGVNNYVAVYKRQGADKNIVKVEKPPITAVEVNRDAQSPFLKAINEMPANGVKPVWLDFTKDIQKGKSGPVEVLAVQNKDNSLFKLYYRYDMGSWNNKLLPVAAQYLQYLGTDKMSAEDISKAFYKLAASYNISSTGEITTVSLTGLQENFAEVVKLYENVIANCKPDEQALAGLKSRLKKSRENAKQNKGSIMAGLVSYAMYGENNPYNNVLTDAELEALKAEDLVAILHDLGNYKNTALYYGPKSVSEVSAQLKQMHFVPASFKPYPPQQQFRKEPQKENQVLFANFDMVQAEINWVRNTGMFDAAKTPTIELFNNYFGSGMSSIVFQTLRESKALAYSTYAYYFEPQKKDDRNYIQAYIGAQADKFNEAIGGMNELLNELPQSEKFLETARDNMRKSLETERITQEAILFTYLNAQRKGLDYDARKRTFDAVSTLKFDDVKKFHASEIKGQPYTYCVVASDKRISDAELEKFGKLKKLSLKEIFGY